MAQELPICMAEEFWRNSQLSVARFYGSVRMNGKVWVIVNSRGMDLFECTAEAEKLGRDKAIPAGEPADLVRQDFVKYYRKLGRNTFVEILKENGYASDKELLAIFKEMVAKKKKIVEHKDLFEQ